MNTLPLNQQGFDPTRFHLGSLCKRNHKWNGTGQTLRYIKNNHCPICEGVKNIGAKTRSLPLDVRFWQRVSKGSPDECWDWTGQKCKKGYGQIWDGSGMAKAHRVSYMLHFGEISNGLSVCHRCDRPSCVAPHHLFLGTNADNVADRQAKGRHRVAIGEAHGRTPLTESDVKEIRQLHATGQHTYASLSRMFGVSPQSCRAIIHRQTWKHVS